jgi:hypothetical protein
MKLLTLAATGLLALLVAVPATAQSPDRPESTTGGAKAPPLRSPLPMYGTLTRVRPDDVVVVPTTRPAVVIIPADRRGWMFPAPTAGIPLRPADALAQRFEARRPIPGRSPADFFQWMMEERAARLVDGR